MSGAVAIAVGSILLVLSASCDAPPQSECHRRAVERAGCCPACDAECRAAVSQECAEIHDAPLPSAEADDEAESTGTSEGHEDDAPREPTPQ